MRQYTWDYNEMQEEFKKYFITLFFMSYMRAQNGKIILLLLVILGLIAGQAISQETKDSSQTSDSSNVSVWRVALVSAAAAGFITAAHLQNYNSWWKGNLGKFHFGEDGYKYLHSDKFGHAYYSYIASDAVGRSLQWANVPKSRSLLYAAGISLAFQFYVEIEDGFHPELGFSIGDAFADIVGSALPLLQYRYKFIRSLSFKWSALPSNAYLRGEYRTLVDDYESQYWWLSMNLEDAFQEHCPEFIPSFLNVAVGYSVKNLDKTGNGDIEIYLGLDLDFTKLPGDGAFLNSIKHILNYFHFPSPTIRLTPAITAYGFRF